MANLTAEQRKALIEAATQRCEGWVDAWERAIPETAKEEYAYYFLAGWAASRGVKQPCCHEHDPETVAVAIVREAEEKR